jgi:hypothetical protein
LRGYNISTGRRRSRRRKRHRKNIKETDESGGVKK